MTAVRALRRPGFVFVGTLPPGDWQFCLVRIEHQEDAIVIVDRTGKESPYMIIDGKLVEV